MVRKQGWCHDCGGWHEFEISGAIRATGIVIGLAGVVAAKHPAPLLLSFASALFGDAIEEWIAARCPECGVDLDLLRVIA